MANIEIHKTKQGGNAVYFFGFIGAIIYYVKQSETFVEFLVAVFKAIVWPAYLVFDLLQFLNA